MELGVYAVLDEKAGAYMSPFFMPTRGMAIRAFTDTCMAPDSMFNKHPGDYTLVHLAEWDDGTGRFSQENVTALVTAADLLARVNPLTGEPVEDRVEYGDAQTPRGETPN